MNDNSLQYPDALDAAKQTIGSIIEDLQKYRERSNHNKYVAIKQQNFITAMENFILTSESSVNELTQVVKKQALIIESAGIIYPTIFQSLEHIYEIYLVKKGRVAEIGQSHRNITVEIPVI